MSGDLCPPCLTSSEAIDPSREGSEERHRVSDKLLLRTLLLRLKEDLKSDAIVLEYVFYEFDPKAG